MILPYKFLLEHDLSFALHKHFETTLTHSV